jgi:glucose-6-phosphate isomerase
MLDLPFPSTGSVHTCTVSYALMHSAQELVTRWPALEVADKRERLQNSLHLTPGSIVRSLNALTGKADSAASGLWRGDPSVWSPDPEVQKTVAERLGWMSSPALMADSIGRLRTFADAVKRDGFTDVVLLGMGGSSLAPEVLRAVIGVAPGWPRFHMLDSTDPAAVRAVATPPATTLYLLASKSGGTIEPNVLAAHFTQGLIDKGVPRWADHFVAITDPGTSLHRRARDERFRDVFENPADIGGRYSALSFFGMVPAALMGQNIGEIVGWGLAMLAACDPGSAGAMQNPAVALGLAMGGGASAGVDKLTLVVPPALDAFGLWVEQLIAESTGKRGKGIVPIAGEPMADASKYGRDRLFVQVRLQDAGGRPENPWSRDAPVVDIDLPGPMALGAEFVRWEVATAVAGALLGIDPFDQPNVQQAKDATQALLTRFKSSGSLPIAAPDRTLANGVALTLSSAVKNGGRIVNPEMFLSLLGDGDYFAVLAYLSPADAALGAALQSVRRSVRDASRTATMFGYGPRYLHSTGQLHKGGPNSGVFLLITAEPQPDLPIPGEPFSFGTLELAQAVGDFGALDASGRRAMHAHLPRPDAALVASLGDLLLAGRRP